MAVMEIIQISEVEVDQYLSFFYISASADIRV